MTDEPRRSGRATKGQNTKLVDAIPSLPTKPEKKKNEKHATQQEEDDDDDDEDDDATIRCVCGTTTEDEDDERMMICCDKCACWQHNECMEVTEDEDALPERYLCEQCDPKGHKSLLARLSRGEKPWEERAKKREREHQDKTGRKNQKGRKGKTGKKVQSGDEHNGQDDHAAPSATSPSPKPSSNEPKKKPSIASESPVKRKVRHEPVEEQSTEPQSKIRKVSTGAVSPGNQQRRPSTQTPAPSRKVSLQEPLQSTVTASIEEIQNKIRKATAEAFNRPINELVTKAVSNKNFDLPPEETAPMVARKLALNVEHALCMNHSNQPGDPTPEYRSRARTMIFNLKKNPALFDRLLQGTLSPDEFSTMSTDDMASEELQQKTAEMKKTAEKQNFIAPQDDGPRIRRTHKGEELVNDDRDFGAGSESIFASAPARRRESEVEDSAVKPSSSPARSPTQASPPSMVGSPRGDSPQNPEKKPLNIDTQMSVRGNGRPRSASGSFDIREVWSSVQSPDITKQTPPTQAAQAIPHYSEPEPTQQPEYDAEIDKLLNDDENESPPYSPTDYANDPSAIWRGRVLMPGVSDFAASARHVAGADLESAKTMPWSSIIADPLSIEGRIAVNRASDYLCSLQYSRSTDVTVVSISPAGSFEAQQGFDKLWRYFHDRNRYGVVGKLSNPAVRDAYVIPVEAGAPELPAFLKILEFMTLEESPSERTILVVYVVRSSNTAHSASQHTPRVSGNAFSPTTPSAPPDSAAYSPTSASVGNPANVHPFARPYSSRSESRDTLPHGAGASPPLNAYNLAKDILGPFVECPVIQQLLSSTNDITEDSFRIIKGILQEMPETRDNISLFSYHLEEKSRSRS